MTSPQPLQCLPWWLTGRQLVAPAQTTESVASKSACRPARALHSMRTLLVGTSPLADADLPPLLALMPDVRVITSYGMTECSSSVTFHSVHPRQDCGIITTLLGSRCGDAGHSGICVGRPAPGVRVSIAAAPSSEGSAKVRASQAPAVAAATSALAPTNAVTRGMYAFVTSTTVPIASLWASCGHAPGSG
jgi:acyl-CoA synthetase (AMP-forming)/AMP-acid ligase II